MIYDNYFQVPDGSRCRPLEWEKDFIPKSHWMNFEDRHFSIKQILGKWEVQEKTITITEHDLFQAWDRVDNSHLHRWSRFDLADELFK